LAYGTLRILLFEISVRIIKGTLPNKLNFKLNRCL
jgi:hypothetical protein